MKTWFTCKVKYQKQDDEGRIKNVTEAYLTDALSFTEAEARIYEEMGQFINVNRGFGFIGYPGRVGIWPEITVITLKKRSLT